MYRLLRLLPRNPWHPWSRVRRARYTHRRRRAPPSRNGIGTQIKSSWPWYAAFARSPRAPRTRSSRGLHAYGKPLLRPPPGDALRMHLSLALPLTIVRACRRAALRRVAEQIESSQLLKVIDQTGKTIYRVQVPRRHTASARAAAASRAVPDPARASPRCRCASVVARLCAHDDRWL